jgi:hypothetical protein
MSRRFDDSRDSGSRQPDTHDHDHARASIAAPFLGIGGLALIVGSVLSWASQPTVDGTATDSFAGSSLPDGRMALGIGVALALMALYMGTTRRWGHWFDADLLALTLGAIATTVIVATWVNLGDGQSADVGLYVSLAGAVLTVIGSVAALATSRLDKDVRDRETRMTGDARVA